MPSLTSADWSAVWLTFQLATVSTVILLLVGTPIAWWLARTRSRLKLHTTASVWPSYCRR